MIDLGSLGASSGVLFDGPNAGGLLGYGGGTPVPTAGDFNGDGVDDLLLPTPGYNSFAGGFFVVFGGDTLPTDLSTLSSDDGFFVTGTTSGFAGDPLIAAGDFNGDGIDDIVVGENSASSIMGQAHVIFGAETLGGAIDLASLGSRGITIAGNQVNQQAGSGLSALGDFDGDGFDDFLVGARGDTLGGASTGTVFGLFGSQSPSNVTITDINIGNGGFRLYGASGYGAIGEHVAAGDFNGDGHPDIVAGTSTGSNAVGIFLSNDPLTIANSTISSNTIITPGAGTASSDNPVAVGDFNGDGVDDLAIGVPNYNSAGGGIYAASGSVLLTNTTLTANNRVLEGTAASQNFGRSLASPGDVNGDGFDDLIVGSDNNQAVVVFGNSGFFADNFFDAFDDLANLASNRGMLIVGAEAGDRAGYSVFGPGDINGDGLNDILIGAPDANTNAGQAALIFGALSASPTSGNDRLTSGFQSDSVAGGDGDDSLFGNGGDDTLLGETGNDLLAGGGDNDSIGGGAGNDTGYGQAGDDSLVGDDGDDILRGNPGDDSLLGAGDNDILRGQPGIDFLDGGPGNDNLFGGADDDRLFGDVGDDTLGGNSGGDSIQGDDGGDLLRGQGGADILFGGDGDDILRGQQGFDSLFGGAGNDLLSGGPADDMITGGDGSDTIESAQNQGSDTGLDFNPDEDMVSIVGFSFADLTVTDTDDGARITITSEGDSPTMALLLSNIDAADVNAGLFVGG